MRDVLKEYSMEITTVGPVFIGSGKKVGKKEYAFSNIDKKIYIMDVMKIYNLLYKKNLVKEYEKFLLGNDKRDVGKWLEMKKVKQSEYEKCVKYQMNCENLELENHSKLEVDEFIKDAYNMPYVPGSSIKGMLRTILLAYDILKNKGKYEKIIREIDTARPLGRNRYLRRESLGLEEICYRILNREKKKAGDAVNDIMSGLIVGDSESLALEDLTLCQRTELHVDGTEKKLNVLREVIKPDTLIKCKITIDTSICPYTIEYINEAIKSFGEIYYDSFLKMYRVFEIPDENMVWLGGGVGFVSKTEVYPLFGYKRGIEKTIDIFEKTKVPDKHKHYKDKKYGVSPHICKVAYCKGKRYQIGLCKVKISK